MGQPGLRVSLGNIHPIIITSFKPCHIPPLKHSWLHKVPILQAWAGLAVAYQNGALVAFATAAAHQAEGGVKMESLATSFLPKIASDGPPQLNEVRDVI